jgi:nitric oxide reductase NorQ protein
MNDAAMSINSHKELPFYQAVGNEIELFEYAWKNQLPLLIKGPTGCGKTRFIQYMAARMEQPLYTVACHDDLTSADLTGRHLISENGTYWNDGPLTRAVREGAICYLDEIVEARKDTTVVLHPLTDDRRILPLDRTGEILKAPDNFMLIVSYNPGYQNLLKGMKPSTRQRFVAISFDYPDAELETEIIIKETGIEKQQAEKLVAIAKALRSLKDHDLEEAASTRLLIYCATLAKDGFPFRDACTAALIEPLTDDEDTLNALHDVINAFVD